jgi:hypothetical protein
MFCLFHDCDINQAWVWYQTSQNYPSRLDGTSECNQEEPHLSSLIYSSKLGSLCLLSPGLTLSILAKIQRVQRLQHISFASQLFALALPS